MDFGLFVRLMNIVKLNRNNSTTNSDYESELNGLSNSSQRGSGNEQVLNVTTTLSGSNFMKVTTEVTNFESVTNLNFVPEIDDESCLTLLNILIGLTLILVLSGICVAFYRFYKITHRIYR